MSHSRKPARAAAPSPGPRPLAPVPASEASNLLPDLASEIVRRAVSSGATGAECTISEGDEFSASIRLREIENLKEAGSRAAGLRILIGKKTGSCYTSDLSREGIDRLVRGAIELAEITTEDPHAGLPDPDELGQIESDLALFSPGVDRLTTEFKIEQAKQAEAAALDADPRIVNSEGAGFDTHTGRQIFANSLGFLGEYRTSYCSLSAVPVARDGESMERDSWWHAARSPERLESPQHVGATAARRALRRLNPVKVPTQKVPVVFESKVAASLLDCICDAVHGMAIYKHESFLAGKLGEKVAIANLTVVDDATIPGLFGTSPFDDEGVPSRRTVVIERGILKSYLLNSYAARKLGMKTTGNASRGLAGNAGIGHGNFYAERGVQTPEAIVSGVANGFYVTELIGMGVNIVTGDYSRGAAGLWIRNGEFAHAVSEVTIAGNLRDMLMNVEVIGSDLEFRTSMSCPTLKIGEMTVGGK
ncbi:MAG TPA: metallopeptidase TldD-related protein [Bryobacteraceae bacterium]|nr:metallopeptidase TldD-related protein [Bryobacteraceae bacterium]